MRDDRELLKRAREDYVLGSDYAIRDLFDRFEQMLNDKEPQSIVWEPKEGETYYSVSAAGCVIKHVWRGSHYDQALLKRHNIYKTPELAEKAAPYQTRDNMVLQAVLNLEPDQNIYWKDKDQMKYEVSFNHKTGAWERSTRFTVEYGYPPLTDEKNVQPLLDYLNSKE